MRADLIARRDREVEDVKKRYQAEITELTAATSIDEKRQRIRSFRACLQPVIENLLPQLLPDRLAASTSWAMASTFYRKLGELPNDPALLHEACSKLLTSIMTAKTIPGRWHKL